MFVDSNLEEQYGEQKYKEYLEKENKQMLQDIATMNEEIERLNKELEKRTKQYENVLKRYQELETKNAQTEYNNKKAIEYLESYNTDFKNCRFGEAPISLRELGDLLDILKGVDKE